MYTSKYVIIIYFRIICYDILPRYLDLRNSLENRARDCYHSHVHLSAPFACGAFALVLSWLG